MKKIMIMLGAIGWNLEYEIGKIKFLIIYFANSTSIYIFATTFISNAKHFYNQTNIYY